jgi:hypothetical protein
MPDERILKLEGKNMKKPKVLMADDKPLNIEPGPLSKGYDAIKASGGIDVQIKVEKNPARPYTS